MEKERPNVGVAAMIRKDSKFLLGTRIGLAGKGTWGFPGGHLEHGEEWEQCAIRETKEETGLDIDSLKFFAVTNDINRPEDRHYITIFMIGNLKSGEAKIMEPEKCGGWEWFTWHDLPKPLFLPIENLIKNGFNPVNI